MGIFSNLFGRRTRFQMVTEQGNGFYNWNGRLYQSDIVRACIRPKVKAVGKLMAKHIRNDGETIKVNPDPYMRSPGVIPNGRCRTLLQGACSLSRSSRLPLPPHSKPGP